MYGKVNEIRKGLKIPLLISHVDKSKRLEKADEAFWDFKCENNLDFPLRYSEMHRVLSVYKKKKRAALIKLPLDRLVDDGLVFMFTHLNCAIRTWIDDDITIVTNFSCDESSAVNWCLGEITKDYKKRKEKNLLPYLIIRDWLLDVPLTSTMLYVQVNDDFNTTYKSSVMKLFTECKQILKRSGEREFANLFMKDVQEIYYGRNTQILCNEKTGSSKITKRS